MASPVLLHERIEYPTSPPTVIDKAIDWALIIGATIALFPITLAVRLAWKLAPGFCEAIYQRLTDNENPPY